MHNVQDLQERTDDMTPAQIQLSKAIFRIPSSRWREGIGAGDREREARGHFEQQRTS